MGHYPPVRPYDLRHTYASWALQGGAPDTHVAKALGHSSTAMVHRVYGHLRPDHLKTVTMALPASPILLENVPIIAQQSEQMGMVVGGSVEKLAQDMPKNPSQRGQNAPKCDEFYAAQAGTKIPQGIVTLRDLKVLLEATTRIELVNGGFAAFWSVAQGAEFTGKALQGHLFCPSFAPEALAVNIELLMGPLLNAKRMTSLIRPKTVDEMRLHGVLTQLVQGLGWILRLET